MGATSLLKSRNYLLFFSGQFVSKLGDGVYTLGLMWLMHVLTNSTFLMSVTLAAGVIPRVTFGPFFGALADRWHKRRTLVATDLVRGFLLIGLTVLTFTHHALPWTLVVFSFVLATMATIFSPSVVVLQKRLVEDNELLQANALQAVSSNVAMVLGPAVAGVLIGTLGLGVSFLIDAVTFFVSVLSLLSVSCAEPPRKANPLTLHALFGEIRGGARVLVVMPRLRALTPFMLLYSFPMMGLENLLIVQFVSNVLHRGAFSVGVVSACIAIGEILSGIVLPYLNAKWTSDRGLMTNMLVASLSVVGVGFSHTIYEVCLLFLIAGFCMSIVNVSFFTGIQAVVPDELLGRVYALLSAMFEGIGPPAQLLWGGLAAVVPIGELISVLGAFAALSGIGGLIHPALRPDQVDPTTEVNVDDRPAG